MLFDYFNFNGSGLLEKRNEFVLIIVDSNFHKEMVVGCSYIWIFSIFERPQTASHVERDHHQVGSEEYRHLKHYRNESRHVLDVAEAWLSSNILRPVRDHDVVHHPSG